MYKRILAIGDIHGEWDKFVSLYRQIDFQPGRDLLVFLGDYIDRGSAPLHVLKWLFAHKNNEHIIILRGNHEQMMLDYYREGGCNNLWLWNGGDVTRDALDEEDSTLKGDFLSFIKELPLSYQCQWQTLLLLPCRSRSRYSSGVTGRGNTSVDTGRVL